MTRQDRAGLTAAGGPDVRLGLRANLPQFLVLAVVNFFVGGMVGLERTVTPLVGSEQFHLGEIAISAFVVVFGLTKAITNAVGGAVTGRHTRKTILIAGWLIGLPVPFMLAWGPSWAWVIAANVLLGVNQGLTWSMTVNMKIDLIGPGRRGMALGINETAGYLGVAVTALATGYLATGFGLRPAPELLGAGYALAGLALSVLAVRDTAAWASAEARQQPRPDGPRPSVREIAALVSWKDRTLAAVSQAGLVNNLNDGLVWVILPVLLVEHGVSVTGVGYVKAFYPFMWAAGMIGTGHLADRIGRKPPIVAGMLIQAAGLAVITAGISHALAAGLSGAFLLGVGTSLVYPTLLAAVSDATHPAWRAAALGIYRFWRDAGYAIGALIGGVTAALASLDAAIGVAAVLTAVSGLLAWAFMRETHPRPAADGPVPPPARSRSLPSRRQHDDARPRPRRHQTRGSAAGHEKRRRDLMEHRSLSPQTLAAQALGETDPATGAVAPVVTMSTNYEQQPDGSYPQGRVYTRADNPTSEHAERLLAALEGGECALFGSGMAAVTAVFQSLLPGDHVLVSRVLYWGVRKWLAEFALTWGLDVEFTDTTDPAAVSAAIRPGRTRLLWLETPANPMWEITDLAAVCELAHRAGVRVAADNTVATPVLTRPFEHGADLVVHSASKYLNGHGDVLAGAVLSARRDPLWERIRSWRRNAGAMPGPFEAWLLQRGMRTLFLRVNRASQTALAIAAHFAGHPALTAVLYPGLPGHPGHQVAARQMDGGFGGMLSIRMAGGPGRAHAVLREVQVFKRATSLGGVESLIEHRRSSEGPSSPVPDDLLRLSIGIEASGDLIADLEAALDAAASGPAPQPASEEAGR